MTAINIGKVPKGIQYVYRVSNRTRTPVQSGLGVYRKDLDADVRTRLRSRHTRLHICCLGAVLQVLRRGESTRTQKSHLGDLARLSSFPLAIHITSACSITEHIDSIVHISVIMDGK